MLSLRDLANISIVTPTVMHGRPYGVEQRIALERLSEERDRAGLQSSLARLVVAVSGENDHRDSRARDREMPEEVEAVHPGHSQIEHQTGSGLALNGSQEIFRGCERLDSEADRRQQISEGP